MQAAAIVVAAVITGLIGGLLGIRQARITATATLQAAQDARDTANKANVDLNGAPDDPDDNGLRGELDAIRVQLDECTDREDVYLAKIAAVEHLLATAEETIVSQRDLIEEDRRQFAGYARLLAQKYPDVLAADPPPDPATPSIIGS